MLAPGLMPLAAFWRIAWFIFEHELFSRSQTPFGNAYSPWLFHRPREVEAAPGEPDGPKHYKLSKEALHSVAISPTSSCFYPRQDDAEKDGETERCLPVYCACSMNDEVPKQSHDDGNNQTYSKHGCKINE
jgi:hypothetical protein